MNEHQAVLHALTLAPPLARPGETVRLCFRTPNLGTAASPPGTVRFALPPELEPQGQLVQPIDPVAPGEDVLAMLDARLIGPLDDGARLTASASLELHDRTLATNTCVLVVRSRPVLDGPESGVSVVARDDETVSVRAVISNEGDGPACDLELVVPSPLGCARIEGDGPARLSLARLDAGERIELAFDARIVAAVPTVVADDAFVRCGGHGPAAVSARERVELQPLLAPPTGSIAIVGRRAEITIAVRNDGWVDARDVVLRVALPVPLRPLEGSIEVDGVAALRRPRGGAFARFERDGAVTTIVLARLAARASVDVRFAAAIPVGFTAACVRLELGGHDVVVPLDVIPVRALRLAVVDPPRAVELGNSVTLVVEVVNAGDVAESIVLSASGAGLTNAADPASRTIAPGAVGLIPLALHLARGMRDDERVAVTIVANDENGERERTELALVARDRAWIGLLEPPARVEGGIAYTLRNAGTTTAREVSVEIGETTDVLGAIAPGASAAVIVCERDARRGGLVRIDGREALALAPLDGSAQTDVRLALDAPAEVIAGAPFTVRARIAVGDPADRIAIRILGADGAAYIPGTTVLDGVAFLDRIDSSPLAGEGLVLRGVPGGTKLVLIWSMLAEPAICEGEVAIGLGCLADGTEIEAEPVIVAVRRRDAFAVRPAGLGYHVEACGISADCEGSRPADPARSEPPLILDPLPAFEPLPPVTRDDAFFFSLALDERRLDEIARVIRGADSHSLASHLLWLRAFFPERESSGDLVVGGALHDAAEALRDVFDRLFVKLRIPGFDVGASDLEDARLRRALVRLFERVVDAEPGEDVYGCLSARVERGELHAILATLVDASYGAPEMLRALLVLIPTAYEDEPLLAAALRRYAEALGRALSRCEGLPSDAYDAALGASRQDDLDDALSGVLAALRARAPFAGAA